MNASIWDGGQSPGNVVNADNTYKFQQFPAATTAQSLFTLTAFGYVPNTGSLEVWINGVFQAPGIDFTEIDTSNFSITGGVEIGDVVSARGLVGSAASQNALSAASQAGTSATAAAAAYQNILGLSLPNLPLSLANGGLGGTYANKAAIFPDLAPTTTKGDLIVHGAIPVRLGVGADGTQLVADSTQPTGMKWQLPPVVSSDQVFAVNDTLFLKGPVNRSFATLPNCVVTYDLTNVPVNTVVNYTPLAGSAVFNSSNGVRVNFPSNTYMQLINKAVLQGIWTGGVTYGRQITTGLISTAKFWGALQLSSTQIVIVYLDTNTSNANNLYVLIYNPTTGSVSNVLTVAMSNVFSSSDIASGAAFVQIWALSTANTFAVGVIGNTPGTVPAIYTFSVASNTIALANSVSCSSFSTATSHGFPQWVQLQQNMFLCAKDDGAGNVCLQIFVVAGTTITPGTFITNSITTGNQVYLGPICTVGTTGFIVPAGSNSSNVYLLACTYVANGTITALTSGTTANAAVATNGLFNLIPVSAGYLLIHANTASSYVARYITVAGTAVAVNTPATVTTATAAGIYASYADFCFYTRKEIARTKYRYTASLSGAFSFGAAVIATNNTAALGPLVLTISGTSVVVSGSLTIGATGTPAGPVYSPSTGNLYYSDSTTSNLLKQVIVNAGTISFGPTLNTTLNSSFNFVNETLNNGNIYTYSVGTGVATLAGAYTLAGASQNIDAVLSTDGKILAIGNYIVDMVQ